MNPLAIGGIVEAVGQVADNLFTSDEERGRLELEGYQAETARLSGQLEVNREEARSQSLFVAGWRPAVGWVSVAALGYQFVLYPLMTWGWGSAQATGFVPSSLPPPPLLDVEALMVLVTGMLGLAGARTVEKLKRVS